MDIPAGGMDGRQPARRRLLAVSAVDEAEDAWGSMTVAPNPFDNQLVVNGPNHFNLRLTNALGEK